MIDAEINESTATIHVVSGKLDVTYEVKPGVIYSGNHLNIARNGYILDLVGVVRTTSRYARQAPYIFAATDFETVVKRALSKARRLERAWRSTETRVAA